LFAGFLILDHAENIFRNFYTEAPPDTTRARRLTGQPLQVSGLPELRRSARTNIGAWEKLLHPWIHATEVFPHASARSVAKDFLSRATSGIAEEVERMAAYLSPPDTVFCRNDACANHTDQVPVDTAGAYDSFGKTTTGSPRWRCSVCDKTFSQNTKATARQRDHHKNKTIIKLLVNKIFVRRIIEVADISPKTFYHRLLGHSYSKVTQRYAHLSVKTLQEAANCVSAKIKKAMLPKEL